MRLQNLMSSRFFVFGSEERDFRRFLCKGIEFENHNKCDSIEIYKYGILEPTFASFRISDSIIDIKTFLNFLHFAPNFPALNFPLLFSFKLYKIEYLISSLF